MSEKFENTTQGELSDEALINAASSIIGCGLQIVSNRYGDGFNKRQDEYIPTERWLDYHNVQHSVDVYNRAMAMAQRVGLEPVGVAVAGLAAAVHDIKQEGGRGIMERDSATWLVKEMERAKFPKPYIRAGELAILGTEPLFSKEGHIVGQVASQQDYPSVEAALIAATVASADMAGMYQPTGPLNGRKLYQEMNSDLDANTFPITELQAFQNVQQHLLESYQFPHPVAEAMFGALRIEVVDYQAGVTRALVDGRIANWAQLHVADQAFADRFSVH